MNKAFTANINDQVTARGYLDENDQLIMLEPEMDGGGGGGDSDVALATATINVNASLVRLTISSFYTIEDETNLNYNYESTISGVSTDKTALYLLYKGSAIVYIETTGAPEVTGNASNLTMEEEGVYYMTVTGDFTLNVGDK